MVESFCADSTASEDCRGGSLGRSAVLFLDFTTGLKSVPPFSVIFAVSQMVGIIDLNR